MKYIEKLQATSSPVKVNPPPEDPMAGFPYT